jgi:hypothetical protein
MEENAAAEAETKLIILAYFDTGGTIKNNEFRDFVYNGTDMSIIYSTAST